MSLGGSYAVGKCCIMPRSNIKPFLDYGYNCSPAPGSKKWEGRVGFFHNPETNLRILSFNKRTKRMFPQVKRKKAQRIKWTANWQWKPLNEDGGSLGKSVITKTELRQQREAVRKGRSVLNTVACMYTRSSINTFWLKWKGKEKQLGWERPPAIPASSTSHKPRTSRTPRTSTSRTPAPARAPAPAACPRTSPHAPHQPHAPH